MAKQKYTRLTSPKGVFKFPRLTVADFKFDKERGAYGTKLLLDPNGPGVQEFLKVLDEEADKAVVQMKEENAKYAKKITRDAPYKMEEDEEGNETGKIEINVSMKAKVVAKRGANIGKTFEFKPALFDSFGKPITTDIKIGGGTVGKVSFECVPYFSAKDKNVGISRRLQAAQIIDLVEWTGGGNAAAYGFGDEDEGFSVNESKADTTDETDEQEETSADAGDF